MGLVGTIALALGASWASGLRLYAVVAALGLLGRYGGLALPGSLGVVTQPWIIALAGVLFCAEFVADKVPLVDSAWDAVQTFVRIPAAAVIAAAAFGDFAPGVQAVALLLGGGVALSAHGAKAATRLAVNASPEPFSNVAVSTAEDGLVLGALSLAILAPAVLIVLVCLAVAATLAVLPRVVRAVRRRRERRAAR